MRANEEENFSGITPSNVYNMMNERCKELSINVNKNCEKVWIGSWASSFCPSIFDELEQETRYSLFFCSMFP